MIRTKPKQTPQEIYWEKKRREEEERDANLPPGLINHGNTCFMNSTLQGLIATRPLHDLVYFQSLPPALQPSQGPSILARRSPQLTNGHGLGGPNEIEWTEGMPLGDVFTTIMRKAWDIQDARRRESMSPKELLSTIGRKYDQYLDFRQQDAHEFLRHMLDAMRMEEADIIKKRQPPPPPKTKRRRAHRDAEQGAVSPELHSHPLPPLPDTPSLPSGSSQTDLGNAPPPQQPKEEDKLQSFVDMLFGGQLASILVCEKCKKVSVTYEDFNDLSLSIKPEDYVKGRKRDRIKKIARKLRIRPPAATAVQDSNSSTGSGGRSKGMFNGMQRASSVPASPVRRSTEVAPHEEEPPTSVDPRRRSFDHPGDQEEARDVVKDMVGGSGSSPGLGGSAIAEDDEAEEVRGAEVEKPDDWTKVEAEVAPGEEKAKEKGSKDKERDSDAWGKLARRISVSMKLGKSDKDKDSRPSSRASDRGRKPEIKDAIRVMRGGEPRSPRTTSLARDATVHETPSDAGEVSDAASPVPASPRVSSSLTQASRPSSTRRSSGNPFRIPAKSPAAPKMSEEEMAYLRRVLADVHPVTGNPLSILSHAFTGGAGPSGNTAALATHALWAKLGHLPGIEECLRMFTAVEILDGENMVGCHRCWKISNGTYKPRTRENGDVQDDSDTDSDSEAEDQSSGSSSSSEQSAARPPKANAPPPNLSETEDGAISSPDLSSGRVSPASASVVSTAASVSSAPTSVTVPSSASPMPAVLHGRKDSVMAPLHSGTYNSLPIPQISTTEVDSTDMVPRSPVSQEAMNQTWSSTHGVIGMSLSDDALLTPRARRRGKSKNTKVDGAEDSSASSDEDSDDSASDTSAPTSVSSHGSASPSVSPRSSVERLSDHQLPSPLASPKLGSGSEKAAANRIQDKKVPRSKQVIPRRMYKRYLISTPPPILVIHLKRFQQTSKAHTVSLSGGFKKLDEFVAFPEYLDLAPFLAPKREEGEKERKEKEKERCMYRLYAVVVHIGNMLGGHYVAYTALPSSTSTSLAATPSLESEKSVSSSTAPSSHDSRTSHSSDGQKHRQWAYISDTVVRLTTLEEVLKAKAYICMYERV